MGATLEQGRATAATFGGALGPVHLVVVARCTAALELGFTGGSAGNQAVQRTQADLEQVAPGMVQAHHRCAQSLGARIPTGKDGPCRRCVVQLQQGHVHGTRGVEQRCAVDALDGGTGQGAAVARWRTEEPVGLQRGSFGLLGDAVVGRQEIRRARRPAVIEQCARAQIGVGTGREQHARHGIALSRIGIVASGIQVARSRFVDLGGEFCLRRDRQVLEDVRHARHRDVHRAGIRTYGQLQLQRGLVRSGIWRPPGLTVQGGVARLRIALNALQHFLAGNLEHLGGVGLAVHTQHCALWQRLDHYAQAQSVRTFGRKTDSSHLTASGGGLPLQLLLCLGCGAGGHHIARCTHLAWADTATQRSRLGGIQGSQAHPGRRGRCDKRAAGFDVRDTLVHAGGLHPAIHHQHRGRLLRAGLGTASAASGQQGKRRTPGNAHPPHHSIFHFFPSLRSKPPLNTKTTAATNPQVHYLANAFSASLMPSLTPTSGGRALRAAAASLSL